MLTTLKITSNSLRIANVSKNTLQSLLLNTPNLEDLYAAENQLTLLDIKTPDRLRKIDVSYNLFTLLDVSNYNSLKELKCKMMPTLKTIIAKNGAKIGCDHNPTPTIIFKR